MAAIRKPSIKRIIQAAEMYEQHLLNKNVLLIGTRDFDVEQIELRFLAIHFMHLTGVKTPREKHISAKQFWLMCANHKLSERYILPDYQGTADMKLRASESIFKHNLGAREFGLANGARQHLDAELFAGNRGACLGLKADETDFLIPQSLLKSSIREEVLPKDTFKVVGVFSKPIKVGKYDEVRRVDPSADWDHVAVCLPDKLKYVAAMAREARSALNIP